MTNGGERLSEEEAQRVWKRAAELQATVADPQSRALAVSNESVQRTGYNLSQVREAAAEAGIAPEFVAVALAEAHATDSGRGDRVERWAERLSGPGPRSLIVSRRFDSPVGDVYAAVQRVFPRHRLVLVDSHDEPLEGGRLVYAFSSGDTGTTDRVVTDLVTRAKVEEIHLRLLPLDQGSCLATLSASLGVMRRAHLGVGAALAAGSGVVGGWAVGALGAALVIPSSLGAAAAAAAIGGATLLGLGAGTRLGIAGSRAAHRSGQQRGTAALERLLQVVGMEVRGVHSEASSISGASGDPRLSGGTGSTV